MATPLSVNLKEWYHKAYETDEIREDFDDEVTFTEIYNALKLVSLEEVKLVIFGQDPYYKINQANGLAFSLNKGVKLTPSLRNIYKEIHNEYGYTIPVGGDLTKLAKQGVLLLNTSLTVVENNPGSHKNIGWKQTFSDRVILSGGGFTLVFCELALFLPIYINV